MRKRIIGVDFSGARDAERKIWIAQGRLRGEALTIEELAPAKALFAARGPVETCKALRGLIEDAGPCVVGIDAPFGLARASVSAPDWPTLLRDVADEPSADAFRRRFGAPEVKRTADLRAKTPFAPTNLRLYRQTYFAMAHLAAPLVAADAARFPPMQEVDAAKPIVIETCPASRLKRLGLYGAPYKGAGGARRDARAVLLDALELRGVRIASQPAQCALEDREGDALDALWCCAVAADVARRAPWATTAADIAQIEAEVFF